MTVREIKRCTSCIFMYPLMSAKFTTISGKSKLAGLRGHSYTCPATDLALSTPLLLIHEQSDTKKNKPWARCEILNGSAADLTLTQPFSKKFPRLWRLLNPPHGIQTPPPPTPIPNRKHPARAGREIRLTVHLLHQGIKTGASPHHTFPTTKRLTTAAELKAESSTQQAARPDVLLFRSHAGLKNASAECGKS